MHLLTHLPEQEVRANVACALYRRRWTLETVFQEITTTLSCEGPSLGYPSATRFAFRLALLASNAVSVRKAALRRANG